MNTEERRLKVPKNTAGRIASYTWYRGDGTNFLPDRSRLCSPDGVLDGVLKGWLPETPFLEPSTAITAFGSCFAKNIADWLHARHYTVQTRGDSNAYVVQCGEGMVNTFTILGQFQWAFEGRIPPGEFWHGYDAKAFGYDDAVRAETRRIFDATDVFILTFGLSEVWYDKPTGEVFWRAVPADKYDPKRHAFRLSTVEENRRNIAEIFALIRRYRPQARIVVTLSPIPLFATFRPASCLTANAVSKGILRAAIDDAVTAACAAGEPVHYWPSYELVTEYFGDVWKPDRRHVKPEILSYIMALFERAYSTNPPSDDEIERLLIAARIQDGTIPPSIVRAIERGKTKDIEAYKAELAQSHAVGLLPAIERAILRAAAARPPRRSWLHRRARKLWRWMRPSTGRTAAAGHKHPAKP
jgi:hypothetical protein